MPYRSEVWYRSLQKQCTNRAHKCPPRPITLADSGRVRLLRRPGPRTLFSTRATELLVSRPAPKHDLDGVVAERRETPATPYSTATEQGSADLVAQPSEERLRQQEALLNERLRFMARASALLGSSLDLDDLLNELARLGLPLLGNGCLIDIVLDGRHTRRLGASLLSDAERELVARFIARARPLEE